MTFETKHIVKIRQGDIVDISLDSSFLNGVFPYFSVNFLGSCSFLSKNLICCLLVGDVHVSQIHIFAGMYEKSSFFFSIFGGNL